MKNRSVFKFALVVAAMALPGFASQALMIGTNAQSHGLPSVCYLAGHSADNSMTYRCSGTLISPTEILTAGHCATPLEQQNMKVEVACGFVDSQYTPLVSEFYHLLGRTTESPGVFRENLPVSWVEVNKNYSDQENDSGSDFAIVHLSKASQLAPIPVLAPADSAPLLAHLDDKNPTIECVGSGYGVDSNNQVGALRTGNMTSLLTFSEHNVLVAQQMTKLTHFFDIAHWLTLENHETSASQIKEALILEKEKALPVSLMAGDSGGPLLCRSNSQDSWKVVGVASAVGFRSKGMDKSNNLVIGEEILWAMPDLQKAPFTKAWPQQ